MQWIQIIIFLLTINGLFTLFSVKSPPISLLHNDIIHSHLCFPSLFYKLFQKTLSYR